MASKSKLQIEIETKLGNTQKDLNSVKSQLKGVGDNSEKAGKKTGFLKNSIGELSDKMKVLSTIGLIGVITGLINAGKYLFNLNKELAKTQKLVSDLTGKAGKDLVDFTAKIQASSDTFETDFKDNITAVNTLVKEFGITYEQALDKVNQGNIIGANSSGEMLDNIKEFSTQAQRAGLNADQFIKLLDVQSEKGVLSDKGIDTIKEATLRLGEMPKATKDAIDAIGLSSEKMQSDIQSGNSTFFESMQKISNKLRELPPQSSKVGQVLANVFGGAGEDAQSFVMDLGQIELKQDALNENLTEQQKSQKQNLETQEKFNSALTEIFGKSSSGFNQMIADAQMFGVDMLLKAITNIKDMVKWFEDLWDSSKGFRSTIEAVKLAFSTLRDSATLILSNMASQFTSLGNIIKGVFTLDKDLIIASAKNLTESLKENFTTFVDDIKAEADESIEAINQESDDLISARAEKRKAEAIANEEGKFIAVKAVKIKNASIMHKLEQKAIDHRVSEEIKAEKKVLDAQQQMRIVNGIQQIDLKKNIGKQLLALAVKETIASLIPTIMASIPFPLNVIVAGTAPAIAQSVLPKFENGGIFEGNGIVGGSSLTGDNINARINSREMILNLAQQKELFDIANGNNSNSNNSINSDALINKLDDLIDEISFSEKNINIDNQLNITPSNLLEVTEQGQRDNERLQ